MSARPAPTPLDLPARRSVHVVARDCADSLTVAECRRILDPRCTLTDEEIEIVRDQLTLLANVAIDALLETRGER